MPTIKYTLKDGTPVRGATTIKGQNVGWGKGALMYWANKQGREGKTMQEAYDTATVPGTIAHLLIECYLKGTDPDLTQYRQEDIDKGQAAFRNFEQWTQQFKFDPMHVEPNLISEKYGYGGTPDVIAEVKGQLCIVDWKTGKIYEDLFLQLVAYRILYEETHWGEIEGYHVLRIPRNEDIPSFHHSYWERLPDCAEEAFMAALTLNRCQPELKKLL